MTSYAKRTEDELLSPDNTVLTVIDYQPTQINSINSMNRSELIRNTEIAIELAKLYNIPIVLSTVNVEKGWNTDTIPVLKKAVGRRSFLRPQLDQRMGRQRIQRSHQSDRPQENIDLSPMDRSLLDVPDIRRFKGRLRSLSNR